MADFNAPQLTPDGELLMAKGQSGATIEFTKVRIGDGILMHDITIQAQPVLVADEEGNFWARLDINHTHNEPQGFWFKHIEVWATDPDNGEICYSTAHCKVDAGVELGSWIPGMVSASPYPVPFSVASRVDNAANVTAIIGDSNYVTWPELQAELDDIKIEIGGKLNTHLIDPMPHRFIDGGVTYQWGMKAVNGIAIFVYEEVI